MHALRFEHYGPPDVLRIVTLPDPAPGTGEALVRVHAVALNPLDDKLRAGDVRLIPAFRGPPRGLGTDFAGEITRVGGGPSQRYLGERVFGSLMPFGRDGALAELIVVPFERLLPLPAGLDAAQAATLPVAGGTALQALAEDARLAAGERVLITGAAGGVGHFAVQIAKDIGATVVGVCSAGNAAFVRSLGADEVIDYAQQDFTQRADRFDVVFDAACAKTYASARRVLAPAGRYLNTGGTAAALFDTAGSAILARLTSQQRAIPVILRNRPALWQRLVELVEKGAVKVHVERIIGLDDVAEAQRAMATGHGRGKIVVRLD